MKHLPTKTQGIIWMLISCFWAACMGAVVRQMSVLGLHTTEVVFYRNFVALVLLLPWLVRAGGVKKLKTTRFKVYLLRSLVGVVAMYFWFYSLMTIPLSDAMALTFTAPLFTAVLAVVFYKEKVVAYKIISLLVGFIGVLIVLRPGTHGFMIESVFAIIAALMWANTGIMIKSLTTTDSPRVVVFYMVLLMTPLSLPMALPYLHMPDENVLFWLLVLGLTSNLFQISLSNAFAVTEVSTVLPFDFMRLVFVSIIAHVAFGEVIDMWTYIGAAVIMFGAVYSAYQERKHHHKYKREMEFVE